MSNFSLGTSPPTEAATSLSHLVTASPFAAAGDFTADGPAGAGVERSAVAAEAGTGGAVDEIDVPEADEGVEGADPTTVKSANDITLHVAQSDFFIQLKHIELHLCPLEVLIEKLFKRISDLMDMLPRRTA